MTRAISQTNTIINTVTAVLDLSQLYGSDQTTAATLENTDGTLQSSGNGLYLPVASDMFVSGDVRVMENPELTALTTLFMREHNYWVGILKSQHPAWTASQCYGMAKAITTAEYQNIIYTEYLPHLVGQMGPYTGYTGANTQITQEFSTGAFRVGHSQVSDTQEGLDNAGNTVFTESLAQSFFNTPEIDEANGIDPLLRSLGVDYAQATDPFVVAALRDLLSATPDQMDLIAIDIQRERDVGIATLNQTRAALGLRPYTSFAQLTSDRAVQNLYAQAFGDIRNVDPLHGRPGGAARKRRRPGSDVHGDHPRPVHSPALRRPLLLAERGVRPPNGRADRKHDPDDADEARYEHDRRIATRSFRAGESVRAPRSAARAAASRRRHARAPSHLSRGRVGVLRPRGRRHYGRVPIGQAGSVKEDDVVVGLQRVEHVFEIRDPVRHAGEMRMKRDREHAWL